MIKISCYNTTQDLLPKTFCQLAEKCYYAGLKTNVITENTDYSQSLDRVLWTYSKKHFIPHATNTDHHPEKQPILITNDLNSLSPADVTIFINTSKSVILNITSNKNTAQLQYSQKILFIFDEVQNIQTTEINAILEKSYITAFEIDSFIQDKKGKWQKP